MRQLPIQFVVKIVGRLAHILGLTYPLIKFLESHQTLSGCYHVGLGNIWDPLLGTLECVCVSTTET